MWSLRSLLTSPILSLILFIALSEPIEATCKHADITRNGNNSPVRVTIGPQYSFSNECGFLIKFSKSAGQLDCSKPVSITISGGVFSCQEHLNGDDEMLGTDSAYTCNCEWEQCVDDVKKSMEKLNYGGADCLSAIKEVFDKERQKSDEQDEEAAYAEYEF